MNKILSFGLLAVVLSTTPALANELTGVWRTEASEEGYLDIRFAPCGAAMCGTIIRARNPEGQEGTDYPHLGRKMIWDMKPDGASNWVNGKIWDPRKDQTFKSKMALQGNQLTVSGCVLIVCQSQTWQKIK